jgi:hypothetical protein
MSVPFGGQLAAMLGKEKNRVRIPRIEGYMLIRSFRLSTRAIHAAVSAMLLALMVQPVTAGACDFPVSKIGDYTDGSISQPVIFIGTVSAIRAIKSDPNATHLITLTVERNFSPESQPPSAVLRSYETGQTYYCGPPRALRAKVGERWLIFGQRSMDLINPDMMLSRQVMGSGPDRSIMEQLSPHRR